MRKYFTLSMQSLSRFLIVIVHSIRFINYIQVVMVFSNVNYRDLVLQGF